MDTAIRTLRPETGKRGRPKVPCHPSSAGSSQKDLDTPIPKELGLPSRGGTLMSVAPNLCCDETKNRGTYTRVTISSFNLKEINRADVCEYNGNGESHHHHYNHISSLR